MYQAGYWYLTIYTRIYCIFWEEKRNCGIERTERRTNREEKREEQIRRREARRRDVLVREERVKSEEWKKG